MYSRGYYGDAKEKLTIPEGYDGTALLERAEDSSVVEESKAMRDLPAEHSKKELKISPPPLHNDEDEPTFSPTEQNSKKFGIKDLLSGLPIGRLKGLFNKGDGLATLFSFDFEDLLIIGIALFLILSKRGDKELGFMLAALIFIK